MPEKKNRSRAPRRPIARVVEDLESSEPSDRLRAIEEVGDRAPNIGAILVALLRGLNDPDENVRYRSFGGLLRAFPEDGEKLSRLLSNVESPDPKVRLASIRQVVTILPRVLADRSGMTQDASLPAPPQPVPVTEDLMKHAGRWVAWTRDRRRVVAVADSFADVMRRAIRSGESDPYVKKVPGAPREPAVTLEDESSDIMDDVIEAVPDAEVWLDSPNGSLGGQRPRNLIGTEMERDVRDLIRGIKDGITT